MSHDPLTRISQALPLEYPMTAPLGYPMALIVEYSMTLPLEYPRTLPREYSELVINIDFDFNSVS